MPGAVAAAARGRIVAGLTRLTAPDPLVTLEEAQLQLRVDNAEENERLEALVAAATEQAERYSRRALVTQTWRLTLDEWPAGPIVVPMPPLTSVESVKYLDTAGVLRTLAADQYVVTTDHEPGLIDRAYGVSWPAVRAVRGTIRVEFTCGYGDPDDVPASLREAVLRIVEAQYDVEATGRGVEEMPAAARALLAPYLHRRW